MDNFGHCSISGSIVSTIHNDSLRNDTLICRIVVVDVKFEEDPNQKWGFDENDSVKEDLYASYKTTTPKLGIKWKSVESNGDYDKLKVSVAPVGAERNVYLVLSDSINYNVKPKQLTTPTQSIEVNNTNRTTEANLMPNIGKFKNDTMQIKIKGYPKIIKQVAVISINENNDDVQAVLVGDSTVSDTTIVVNCGSNKFLDTKVDVQDSIGVDALTGDTIVMAGKDLVCNTIANNTNIVTPNIPCSESVLQDSLNKIYQGANLVFNSVIVVIRLPINYDIDRDGLLAQQNGFTEQEWKIISSKVTDTIKRMGDPNDYYLVVVNQAKYNSSRLLGRGNLHSNEPKEFRFVLILSQPQIGKVRMFTNTVAHELGHGAFGLQHPFHENQILNKGYIQGMDPNNFMDYQDGHKSRKYQWNQIHYFDKRKIFTNPL